MRFGFAPAKILAQLVDGNPRWRHETKFGNGQGNHILVTEGTGPIRLDFLNGVSFSEGQYCIEFKFKDGSPLSGGKIHYNLYIE